MESIKVENCETPEEIIEKANMLLKKNGLELYFDENYDHVAYKKLKFRPTEYIGTVVKIDKSGKAVSIKL